MTSLLPPEQLIIIARNCVRKYRPEHSPEFEDFRQDVLLGILERQMFFNPDRGTMRQFVLTVAQQAAKRCKEELRCRQKQAALNPRTQLRTNANVMDADEADDFGLLIEEDETLRFVQWTVFLSEDEMNVLILRLSRCSRRTVCEELYLTKIRYAEIINGLKSLANELF